MVKRREIKNSTAEFLIFQVESKADGVEVMYAEKTVWCTQDAIAMLFDKGRSTITEHLNNIFSEGDFRRIQYVGNSDELHLMGKNIRPNSTTSMPSSAWAIG